MKISMLPPSVALLLVTIAPPISAAEPLTPPYSESFESESFLNDYTIIDVNNDGVTWTPYLGSAQISYNSNEAMNDWLITPALALEGGKVYSFSIDVLTGSSSFEETFEVMYGQDKTPEAMTGTIIERTSVAHTSYKSYSGTLTPAQSGTYYIGIHGCSEADMLSISLKNLNVGEAKGASAPAAPLILKIESWTNGELKADITLKAPSQNLDGEELTELESVKVMRDGTPVKTFSNPTPGSELVFTDEVPACARYTYSAIAVNGSGESPATEAKSFVGTLEPSDPTGITLTETDNPGEVTLAWTPVTTDIRGNELNPEFVTYRIYGGEDMASLLFDNIKGSSHTFQAIKSPTEQAFVRYAVVAETKGGISNFVSSPFLPIGPAYTAPYTESFPAGKASHIIGTYPEEPATWEGYTNETGIEAQDGDNGFFGSKGSYLEDFGSFVTGRISLEGLETPILSFYTYNIVDEQDRNMNQIDVTIMHDGTSNPIKSFIIGNLGNKEGWYPCEVALDSYKGKTIQVKFTSRHAIFPYIFIDNIRIDNYGVSAIESVTTPAALIAGQRGEICVKGAAGKRLTLFTTDGGLVTELLVPTDEYRHALPPGIYIARIGQKVQKIVVR